MKTKTIVEISATLEWRWFREPEAQRWVAECNALGLVLEAKQYSELTDMIGRGLNMLFRDLAHSGELPKFLRKHHWTMRGALSENLKDTHFDVPFELIAAQRQTHGSSHRAH